MSPSRRKSARDSDRQRAAIFAALGDETRLKLLAKLSEGRSLSISRLAEDSPLTRQAVTRHLLVLQTAGLVRGVRQGRENLFQLEPDALNEARQALDRISKQWDHALASLKAFVENDDAE